MDNYHSYIICTSPRSGSTLLCRLLAATEQSGKPDSHFHSPSVIDWMDYYQLSNDNFANEQDLLAAIFRAAHTRGKGNTGIFGLRMQSNSFSFFLNKLATLCNNDQASSDVERIEHVFGKTLFIHLHRDNKLEQAISLVKANQTGLWHKAPDGTEIERTSAPQTPHYDADAIAHHLADLTEQESRWNAWFTEQALEPLRINYDELSANPSNVLVKVLRHLNLDTRIAHDISLPVAKLADGTSAQWAERFMSTQGA